MQFIKKQTTHKVKFLLTSSAVILNGYACGVPLLGKRSQHLEKTLDKRTISNPIMATAKTKTLSNNDKVTAGQMDAIKGYVYPDSKDQQGYESGYESGDENEDIYNLGNRNVHIDNPPIGKGIGYAKINRSEKCTKGSEWIEKGYSKRETGKVLQDSQTYGLDHLYHEVAPDPFYDEVAPDPFYDEVTPDPFYDEVTPDPQMPQSNIAETSMVSTSNTMQPVEQSKDISTSDITTLAHTQDIILVTPDLEKLEEDALRKNMTFIQALRFTNRLKAIEDAINSMNKCTKYHRDLIQFIEADMINTVKPVSVLLQELKDSLTQEGSPSVKIKELYNEIKEEYQDAPSPPCGQDSIYNLNYHANIGSWVGIANAIDKEITKVENKISNLIKECPELLPTTDL